MTLAIRLASLKADRSMTTEELSSKSGVPVGTINKILNGETKNPTTKTLKALAIALGSTVEHLFGGGSNTVSMGTLPPNIIPMPKMKKVPVLGKIACGEPIYADEQYEDFAEVDIAIKCDFALVAQGDSMVDAGIKDGYVVFIRKQDTVIDGEIAAVILDDDATLKRIHRAPGGTIMLEACNPKYKPIFVGGPDETRVFRVLGKAVAFQGYL